MISKFPAHWVLLPTSQKIAYVFGLGLILTGFAHLLGYLLTPEAALSGPTGFRKPMVFGMSAGLTLMTMGWLLRFFPSRQRLHTCMMSAMSAALVIEIAIIDLQRFRGLPSHFNIGTPLDTALWSTMGLAIYVFAIVATTQTILSFGKLATTPAMALAIRSSLAIFFFSQISGQFIVFHGMGHVLQDGAFISENMATSTTVGTAGNLKLPHAIALHSIQALPLLGLLLMGANLNQRAQRYLVASCASGFATIVAIAQIQAFAGKDLLDLAPAKSTLLAFSAAAFALPFAIALYERGRKAFVIKSHSDLLA